MSFRFAAASSQRFLNDANNPYTTVPFTIGCWVRPADVTGTKTVWCIVNTGATNSYWRLDRNAGTAWNFSAAAGGTAATASSGVPVTNAWAFILCRAISATNRRIHVLQTDTGTISNAQNTTSRAPTSISAMALGTFNGSTISQYWDGDIAEFWHAGVDIWPDGTAMPDHLFRSIACRGPLAWRYLAKNLVEWRAFREAPVVRRSDGTHRGGTEKLRDVMYVRQNATRVWDNLGGDNARMAPHPPFLRRPYRRLPSDQSRLLTV